MRSIVGKLSTKVDALAALARWIGASGRQVPSDFPRQIRACKLLNTLLKVISPHLSQCLHSHHSSHQIQVVLILMIETDNISNLYLKFVTTQQADRVSSGNFTLLEHGKVESSHPTPQESLKNIVTPKLDAKL